MHKTCITKYSIRVLLYISIYGKTLAKAKFENLMISQKYVHRMLKREAVSKFLCVEENKNYWLYKSKNGTRLYDCIHLLVQKNYEGFKIFEHCFP